MMQLIANDYIFMVVIGAIAFFVVYRTSDNILSFLHRKSLGTREEVLRLMDLMFIEVDQKKVTITMLLLSFGLGGIAFFALWPNITASLVIGGAITVIGWSVPKHLVNHLYEKRCSKFVSQLVDASTILANGVSTGRSVSQSMERVVENMPNPISQEFGMVLSQLQLGLSLEEALNNLGTRIPRPDVQMLVTSVNILKETGGNMPETFKTISETIRERQKIEKKIEALTAQGIMQGIIVTLVPFFLLVVFMVIDPTFVKPLFTTTLGIILLMVMVTLQIIGGVMIRKIVKIKI